MVVDAIDTLVVGNVNEITLAGTNPAAPYENRVSSSYSEFKVSVTVFIPPAMAVKFVVAAILMPTDPNTSQSPAVREILVIVFPDVALTAFVSDTALPTAIEEVNTSPTYPAAAESLVVVPTICLVDGAVIPSVPSSIKLIAPPTVVRKPPLPSRHH